MDQYPHTAFKRRTSYDRAPTRSIPPPVTASIYLPARSRPSSQLSRALPTQPRPWYRRKADQLESDLQVLLDAQASHLLDPLSAPSPSSASSTTSDAFGRSASHSRSLPTDPSQISLRAARAGLYNIMRRLAALKDEELDSIGAAASSAATSHEQLMAWVAEKEHLRTRVEEIAAGPDTAKAQALKEKADQLQPEITELEDRLAKLRNEQKRLRRQADETANRTEARLSVFTRELDRLDKQIKEYLAFLPRDSAEVVFDTEDQHGHETEDERAFWQLAPQRRTLEMATEVLGRERERAERRLEASENEWEALIDGAVVWKDTVKLVEGFEKALRADMADLADMDDVDPVEEKQGLQDALTAMDGVIEQLESQLRLVETKDWKLLIAAIGAELDAFNRGRHILRQTLGLDRDETSDLLVDGVDEDEPGSRTPTACPSSPINMTPQPCP